MRQGLQAKPSPPSSVDAVNRGYGDANARGVYAYSEVFTVAAAGSSGSIYLGGAPFAGSAIALGYFLVIGAGSVTAVLAPSKCTWSRAICSQEPLLPTMPQTFSPFLHRRRLRRTFDSR